LGLLSGKRALVVGVANKRSIAWGIARSLAAEGAELALTYQHDRFRENLEKLVPELPGGALMLPLDVADDDSLSSLAGGLAEHWPQVDVVVHSVAFARSEDLQARLVEVPRDGYALAQDVSAYSLIALIRAVLPLMRAGGGGSVMTMTYLGSERVVPNYNMMGVVKAALEANMRYLAWDLGGENIRVNAISAGPLRTLASSAVKGATALRDVPERTPLKRNISLEDVGNAAAFLASDWAQNITGQVLFVDAGFHIMGT